MDGPPLLRMPSWTPQALASRPASFKSPWQTQDLPQPPGSKTKTGVGDKAMPRLSRPDCALAQTWASWSYGCAPHKRREQPILQHRILQWRLLRDKFSCFFRKYDITNAYPSLALPGVQNTVYRRRYDYADRPFVLDRVNRAMVVLEAHGERVLLKPGSGVLQGDGGAPRLFTDTHDHSLHSWHTSLQKYTAAQSHPVFNFEHDDEFFPEASAVQADDLARAGTCTSYKDLRSQCAVWDRRLDEVLEPIQLAQNSAKRKILVSTCNPAIIEDLENAPKDEFRCSCEVNLRYLGCTLNWKGDISGEVKERIQSVVVAYFSMGKFWCRANVSLQFKLTVYRSLVLSSLLTGLECAALEIRHLHMLETAQNKFLRKIMCGRACSKIQETTSEGLTTVRYRALSSQSVRQTLKVYTVTSELRARRLAWLKNSS